MNQIEALQKKLFLSLVLGVAVILGLTLFGNTSSLLRTLGAFRWELLPAILGLTLLNYALRFVKWHFYLVQIGVNIGLGSSFAIFSSGLCMAMTPGKVGELLKPVLLRISTATPVSRSVPVVMAERLTDGIAMLLLAVGGLLLARTGWQILVASTVLALVVLGFLGNKTGGALLLAAARRLPGIGSRLSGLDAFLHSARTLFSPRNLAIAVAIGFVSWSGEAVAFYLVLLGLGLHASGVLLIQSAFVLATATLVGSLSMLPGGLGAADASVSGLLLLVVHTGRAKAAAGTILIRFCTLWFGVSLGLVALILFRKRFETRESDLNDGEPRHADQPAVSC